MLIGFPLVFAYVGQYLFSALKTSAVSGVDALVKAVAQQWPLTGTIRYVHACSK